MLTCTLAISLTPANAYAAPGRQPQTAASSTEAAGEPEAVDGLTLDAEDMGGTGGAAAQEGLPETEDEQEGTRESVEDIGDTGRAEGQDTDIEDSAVESSAAPGQNRVTAERIQAEKNTGTAAPTIDDDSEDEETEEEYLEEDDEEKPAYTAPEDSRHVNASFAFAEAASSAYFKKLTYPVSISLKEVDTGDRVTLTIRSAGQILEVEKGDYSVVSIKDSGKVPLSVPGDTLHIYENTEYQIRFAANNALKMLTDFLVDNIFFACFFVCAALLYKKIFIPMFANDVKKR